LANLLTVLIHYHTIPSEEHWIFGAEDTDRDAIAEMNIAQSRAILKIFEWLGTANNGIPNEVQLNRFENAVQRMGLKDSTSLDKTEQWERYAENLLKIKRFFDMCVLNKYTYSRPKAHSGKDSYDYIQLLNYTKFEKYIKALTTRTRLFKKDSYKTYYGYRINLPEYIASRTELNGYDEINWKSVE
jgi:hypothetical protein